MDKSTSSSLEKRYDVTLIVILLISSRRRPAPGGDVDYPTKKRINSLRMDGVYELEVVKDQFQPRWNEWDDEEPKAPTKEKATPPK
jgi:hypothetical protein